MMLDSNNKLLKSIAKLILAGNRRIDRIECTHVFRIGWDIVS
jgi:hypothetical protein